MCVPCNTNTNTITWLTLTERLSWVLMINKSISGIKLTMWGTKVPNYQCPMISETWWFTRKLKSEEVLSIPLSLFFSPSKVNFIPNSCPNVVSLKFHPLKPSNGDFVHHQDRLTMYIISIYLFLLRFPTSSLFLHSFIFPSFNFSFSSQSISGLWHSRSLALA